MFQDKSTVRPKLVLFCGLPGSGKTTLARKLEKELPAVRLCPDEWMANLGIDLFNNNVRDKLEVQLWSFAQSLLNQGQNVILENGLWSKAERDDKRRDAAELDIDVELHHLDVPLEELIRRLEIRNVSGGHDTVPLTREHMEGYAKLFQAPDEGELALFTNAVVHRPQNKQQDFAGVVKAIRSLPEPKDRPIVIAISGFGGSGKSTLAAKLKEQLGDTQVISGDDFILSSTKHLADNTGEWTSYDHPRLIRQVLEPALQDKDIRYQAYDWPNDRLVWRTMEKSSRLIIEGVRVLHPDLRKYYDLSIWLDCPLEVATRRGMQRDREWGADHDDLWLNTWMPGGRMFFEKYRPDLATDITFNTN